MSRYQKLLIRGLCLSVSSARTAAFVSVGGGRTRVNNVRLGSRTYSRNVKSAINAFRPATAAIIDTRTQSLQQRQECRFRTSKTLLSASPVGQEMAVMGQDAGEMFDIYLPPDSLSLQSGPPKSAGFRKARALVHKDGDWHRSVHIWLHNSKGELVLQKRSSLKDTFPGMWDVSVGGHFTSGESSLQTAIKETQEELGLECSDDTLRFVCTVSTSSTGFTPDHGEFICNEYKDIYLLGYDGAVGDLQFSPGEVEDVKFVHMDQLKEIYSSQDPGFIPRPSYYTEPLFTALNEVLGR